MDKKLLNDMKIVIYQKKKEKKKKNIKKQLPKYKGLAKIFPIAYMRPQSNLLRSSPASAVQPDRLPRQLISLTLCKKVA